MSQLPTLNQYLGPGGQYPQTVPGYTTIPDQNNQQQPQQPGNWGPPHGNWNQGHHHHGHWKQGQQGNWNQPQQGNWNQPQQGNWNQNPGYAQQPQGGYYNSFSNEIYNLRNQYGMQIPDNQIDQTLEAAKANKRMYAFPEKEMFLRYDQKGKSYILSTHSLQWVHKDNPQYYTTKNDPACYDGTATHLIKVCWLSFKIGVKHVKPGNYQVFFNQAFENAQIKGQMKLKIFVGDKEVFSSASFPNDEMVKSKTLTEHFICNIKREDFDYNKLDNNGDMSIRVEVEGNNNSWKKGWIFDGVRVLEV